MWLVAGERELFLPCRLMGEMRGWQAKFFRWSAVV